MLWHVIACERAWCQIDIIYNVYSVLSHKEKSSKLYIFTLQAWKHVKPLSSPLYTVHCTGLSHQQYTKFKLTHNSLDTAPLNAVTFNEGIKNKVCLVTYFVW